MTQSNIAAANAVAARAKRPERFLSLRNLIERGVISSKTQARRMWMRGDLPLPVHLSERVIAFKESEVEAWVASRQYAPTFGAGGKRLSKAEAKRRARKAAK